MDNRDDTNMWSIISALAIGGLIGAGIMVLFAPQSGRKTRRLLADKSKELGKMAVESTSKAGKMVGEFTQQAVDGATNVFRHGKDMGEDVKSNIEQEAKSKSLLYRR